MRQLPFRPIPAQVTIAILALGAMALSPPASGAMLLIPIAAGDGGAVARAALGAGAVLLGSGPFVGSLVVVGNRSRISMRVGLRNALIIAAPPAGCTGGPVGSVA